MEIRPLTEAERKYTYNKSVQIQGQTGCIGHLRGDFDRNGMGFFTSWEDHAKQWKTDAFKAELDDVINELRSDVYGLLKNRSAMMEYTAQHPESVFEGNYCREYGFRAETETHAFLIRCNPLPGDYNFYCYCYIKEWLDGHIREAEKGIRFIDSKYKELFRIADGEKIVITDANGEKSEHFCRYIDECHTEIGHTLFHICQFAEIMERRGAAYAPAEPEVRQAEEEKQEEAQGEEKTYETEKTTGVFELKTSFGTTEQVELAVSAYTNNKSLYVGMITRGGAYPEPYGDITTNLMNGLPPYCAFVNTNNMPELEDFLIKNRIAEFTGLTQKSGYCEYPLYMFDGDRLRELCPNGMAEYEQINGIHKNPEKREKGR